MKIRKANLNDSESLTALTMRSKAYWGYSPAQIEAWRDALTITPTYIEEHEIHVFSTPEDVLIGYYSYYTPEPNTIKLDNLFIEPQFIGKGHGKKLMQHFISLVEEQGATKIRLDSEPKASPFYEKFGFSIVGQLPTSIKDRYLPIMELDLKQDKPH